MRLWTIQPVIVWERLQQEGFLFVDPSLSEGFRLWPQAYQWMRQQMLDRFPSCRGCFPWWAWVMPKPDLRKWRHYKYSTGIVHVRLEIEIPTRDVVISSLSAWEMVLGGGYVGLTWADQVAWDKKLELAGFDTTVRPLPQPYQSQLIESWSNIFDLQGLCEGANWSTDYLQATFEALSLSSVIQVTYFHT